MLSKVIIGQLSQIGPEHDSFLGANVERSVYRVLKQLGLHDSILVKSKFSVQDFAKKRILLVALGLEVKHDLVCFDCEIATVAHGVFVANYFATLDAEQISAMSTTERSVVTSFSEHSNS